MVRFFTSTLLYTGRTGTQLHTKDKVRRFVLDNARMVCLTGPQWRGDLFKPTKMEFQMVIARLTLGCVPKLPSLGHWAQLACPQSQGTNHTIEWQELNKCRTFSETFGETCWILNTPLLPNLNTRPTRAFAWASYHLRELLLHWPRSSQQKCVTKYRCGPVVGLLDAHRAGIAILMDRVLNCDITHISTTSYVPHNNASRSTFTCHLHCLTPDGHPSPQITTRIAEAHRP